MFPQAIKLSGVSIAASLTTSFVILSFPNYFFYIPFANGVNFSSVLAFTSMLGWISLIVSPILFFWNTNNWTIGKAISFIFLISIYTFSTLQIKVNNLLIYGQVWAEYLLRYPVLFLIEWIIPIFYVLASLALVKKAKREARNTSR